jgi:hypothetical protein
MISWEQAKEFLVWEGSFPHVVTSQRSEDHWDRVLRALPECPWSTRYWWDGEAKSLPRNWLEADTENGAPLLQIDPSGLKLNTHFHDTDLVEFNLDPRDYQTEDQFKKLLAFMIWFANTVRIAVRFTPPGERSWQIELFKVEPVTGE